MRHFLCTLYIIKNENLLISNNLPIFAACLTTNTISMNTLRLLLSCLLVIMGLSAYAQEPNLKWGKPSPVEWSLQAWGEAPDAEAIILCKTVNVTYEIRRGFTSYSSLSENLGDTGVANMGTNNNQNATANYEVKLRLKVLKEQGARYANLDIVYYNTEEDRDERDLLQQVKVTVLSKNDKDKVQKRAIKTNQFSETRLNPYYVKYHIQVPDVQVGDIIEYQYSVTSNRSTYLYDCSMQEDIPMLYVRCDMDIPAFLQFDMKVPIHPFIKSRVEPSAISGPQRTDMKAPDRYPSNHYIIEGHDILPKGLDLQRQQADAQAAQVQPGQGKLMETKATIKLRQEQPQPMPEGQKHINLNR